MLDIGPRGGDRDLNLGARAKVGWSAEDAVFECVSRGEVCRSEVEVGVRACYWDNCLLDSDFWGSKLKIDGASFLR